MSAPAVHTLYFEDLRVGMRETLMRTVMDEDVIGFARDDSRQLWRLEWLPKLSW